MILMILTLGFLWLGKEIASITYFTLPEIWSVCRLFSFVDFYDCAKLLWNSLKITFILFFRSFCQCYDMHEHSTKVFHDLVNSLASFIQSLFSGAGQQTSSSTPPHSVSSHSIPLTQSPQEIAINTEGKLTTGFHYHGVWLPFVKLPSGHAKPV